MSETSELDELRAKLAFFGLEFHRLGQSWQIVPVNFRSKEAREVSRFGIGLYATKQEAYDAWHEAYRNRK